MPEPENQYIPQEFMRRLLEGQERLQADGHKDQSHEVKISKSDLATLQMIENELNERAPGMYFVLSFVVFSRGNGSIVASFTTELSPQPHSQIIGRFDSGIEIPQALIDAQLWMQERLKNSDEALRLMGLLK